MNHDEKIAIYNKAILSRNNQAKLVDCMDRVLKPLRVIEIKDMTPQHIQQLKEIADGVLKIEDIDV